jgi:hypothetical protein
MPGATHRFGLLLAVLGVSFFFLGVTPDDTWARALTTVLAGATLLLAFRVAYMPPRRLQLAAFLVAMVVVAAVVAVLTTDGDSVVGSSLVANGLLVGLAPPAVALGVQRGFRAHRAVTIEAVLGALCLFMFVGLFFGFVYGAVDKLGGDPFFAGGAATTPKLVYFSFTTVTTVGYGDLTARSDLGHVLSASEALIGQIYLVTVVALIVGNLAPRRSRHD